MMLEQQETIVRTARGHLRGEGALPPNRVLLSDVGDVDCVDQYVALRRSGRLGSHTHSNLK